MLEDIRQTLKDYMSLKMTEYKLKGAESSAIVTNRLLVILVMTILGGIILQLLGFSVAFMAGELLGSIPLGFGATALVFAAVLGAVYANRKRLFLNRMVRMYVRMFFEND